MKKVFSAILALVMVFSLFPAEVFAFAEEPGEENALGEILPPEDLDAPSYLMKKRKRG